ncbi:hypothetical protein NDU88_012619 [Pleurodeles waltl]|uniref:Uncharacterized protein n=1 Tax=Pleurodeles waltl TaxID=8319 RepID=A0AAV7R3R7_PLEWA|nr:hypothetical protein NDU88_012619 [Pleurodeles waltl]
MSYLPGPIPASHVFCLFIKRLLVPSGTRKTSSSSKKPTWCKIHLPQCRLFIDDELSAVQCSAIQEMKALCIIEKEHCWACKGAYRDDERIRSRETIRRGYEHPATPGGLKRRALGLCCGAARGRKRSRSNAPPLPGLPQKLHFRGDCV